MSYKKNNTSVPVEQVKKEGTRECLHEGSCSCSKPKAEGDLSYNSLVIRSEEYTPLARKTNKFFKLTFTEPKFIINEKKTGEKCVVCEISAYLDSRTINNKNLRNVFDVILEASHILDSRMLMYTGKGVAKCSKDDEFSVNFGMRLAESKARTSVYAKLNSDMAMLRDFLLETFVCVDNNSINYVKAELMQDCVTSVIIEDGVTEDDKYLDSISNESK